MRAKAQRNIQLRIVHVAIDHAFGHVARAGTNMASHKFQTLIVVRMQSTVEKKAEVLRYGGPFYTNSQQTKLMLAGGYIGHATIIIISGGVDF